MAKVKFANVQVINLPEEFCFKGSAADIIIQIAAALGVALPSTITNVVVGNQEPTDIQNTALWVRTDGAGNFIGLYVVSAGAWVPLVAWTDYTPVITAEAPMVWTAISTTGKFYRLGNSVTFHVVASGTTSGTASAFILVPLPAQYPAILEGTPCYGLIDDGVNNGIASYISIANQRAVVTRYDSSVYNITTPVRVRIGGIYEIAP